MLVMTRLYLGMEGSIHEDINIIIEDGHRNSQQAIEQISNWKKTSGTILRIASHGLVDKIKYPILQAADLTAYAWWEKRRGGHDRRIFPALSHGAARLPAMFLPWKPSCISAVHDGVSLHRQLRKEGIEGRNFTDLALW
jgi:hypothetical protein